MIATAHATPDGPVGGGTVKRILVVDDDSETREEISSLLTEEGYDVRTSDNGQGALELLRHHPVDLIVLDLRMPVMDGWKFRTIQRTDPDISEIPVIAVSADDSAQAEAVHADHYLRKPLRIDELLLAIERLFMAQERRVLAENLRTTERLALLGTVAAGVGHEINNPLTYVLASLDFALNELSGLARQPETPPAHSARLADVQTHLRDVLQGAERIREVVASLRWLSRPRVESHRAVDISRVLETSIVIASNEIRHRARLEKHLRDVPGLRGDESRLGQVFVNLLVNAAQAIPPGATDSNRILVATFTRGDFVAIEVRDTGVGISPELHAKIFEPFFTTKDVASGTGLGLSISQNIVQEHGGRIELESAPGKGSVFRVLLPFERPHGLGDVAEPGVRLPPLTERRMRLLVIDDDALVLSAIERMLRGEHEVITFGRARAAVDHISADRGYDAILCDLMMPEMTGMEFYDEMAKLDPALAARIVFMTGGAFAPEARDFLRRVRVVCLDKPVTKETLRAALMTAGTPRAVAAQRT